MFDPYTLSLAAKRTKGDATPLDMRLPATYAEDKLPLRVRAVAGTATGYLWLRDWFKDPRRCGWGGGGGRGLG